MGAKDIAFDFGLMFSVWFIGMLVVTAFCYGMGDYAVPEFVSDVCAFLGTTPHKLAQFSYMAVILLGVVAFFGMTIYRQMRR